MGFRPRLVLALILSGLMASPSQGQTIVSIGSGFSTPIAIATDSSRNVIVADPNSNTPGVKRILAAGGYQTVQILAGGAGHVSDVAFDRAGNLFIAAGIVFEIPAAGGYTTVKPLPGGGPYGAASVAVDGEGNVFFATGYPFQGAGGVYEIPAAGGYATAVQLGSGFLHPGGVAVDAAGNVYVADTDNNAIKELPAGNYGTVRTLASLAQVSRIAVDANGNLFATAIQEIGSLFELPAGGSNLKQVYFTDSVDQFAGMAIAANGDVFVADSDLKVVKQVLAASGYKTATTISGGFKTPEGVALDSAGNLFVADIGLSAIQELSAASNYASVKALSSGITRPDAVAVDAAGNIFVADSVGGTVQELLADGGYDAAVTVVTGLHTPVGVALDSSANLFVAELFGIVSEYTAASGYTLATPIKGSYSQPSAVALDSAGNLFVTDNSDVYEFSKASGYAAQTTLNTGLSLLDGIAVDPSDNVFVANSAVTEILAAGNYKTTLPVGSGFAFPNGIAFDAAGDLFVADTQNAAVKEIAGGPPPLAAAVLPGSRSVQQGTPATFFATVINTTSNTLDNCQIAQFGSSPYAATLSYQTTNPSTNALTGTPNTPVAIAGNNGVQSFLLTFKLSGLNSSTTALPLNFFCQNTTGLSEAPPVIGVNTIDLSFSFSAGADVIALAVTSSRDGIAHVPTGGGAFAVATSNAGTTEQLTVLADTGSAVLPLRISLCQTNPSSGHCLAPPAATVALNDTAGSTPTFSVFLQATGTIPFAPGASRVFIRFNDQSGGVHGSTSVAVETN